MSRFNTAIKELRIHLCQTSKASQGVREFVKTKYVGIKKDNPSTPILIRECAGAQPRIWVRYEKGVERNAALKDLSAADVMKSLQNLTK